MHRFLFQLWHLVADHPCFGFFTPPFQHHASHLHSVPFLAGLAVTSHKGSVATINYFTVVRIFDVALKAVEEVTTHLSFDAGIWFPIAFKTWL